MVKSLCTIPPGRTVAIAVWAERRHSNLIAAVPFNTERRAARTLSSTSAGLCAGAVAEPDLTNWTTKAVGAVAATALLGRLLGAGLAIRYTRRFAIPAYALLSLCAEIEAAAAVPLISPKIYAPTLAAGLVRSTTVGAAATVALVSLKVYTPISTASLPF